MLNPEGCGEAFLQVRPGTRTTRLLGAMIEEAAHRLARPGPDGRRLRIWAPASDEQLADALAEHGHVMTGTPEDLRCASLDAPVPDAPPLRGYQVRSLEPGDFPARGLLSQRVFHPEPDGSSALTDAQYRVIQRGPLYRRDLDLVVVAPDGCLAGFATVWFDDLTRTGVFGPVGVDPDHRRRGLGRALLAEGMRRLLHYRARCALIGSYGPEAAGLYESVGLIPYERLDPWVLAPGR
jgi:predicted N-acetyltransferase YhbS